ncbi:hypothetical protein [Microcystis sp.]|jgi:hypothetical protein|uniref:hypothetical protein n=2 Tax=Microcystis TaxID=1125 RepID=UPI0022BA8887|nr:hypothetical protein [Microcystis sp. LE19-12.2C]MDJ0549108.1 hypothetical protein [Microcystis sp. M49637_WE12]
MLQKKKLSIFNRQKQNKHFWIIKMAIIFITSLLLIQTISFYSSVYAQSSLISLEILPTSVELPISNEEAKVLIIIRNTSTKDRLQEIKLADWWLSSIDDNNLSININGDKKENIKTVDSLPPGGEFTWTVKLSQKNSEPIIGKVYFQIDYQNKAGISKVANAVLEVKSQTPKKAEEIVDIEIKTTLETLNENRSALAYLIIKNKAYFPITIEKVVSSKPSFISFEKNLNLEKSSNQNVNPTQSPTDKKSPPNKAPIQLQNGETVINQDVAPNTKYSIPINIKAGQQVKPGKHTLLFDIKLKWKQDEKEQTGNVIEEKEVNVGVFGESAILELLKVPSLFILPGFLVLMTIRQLWIWRLFRANDEEAEFPLNPDQVEFWFFGVFISLTIAFVCNVILKNNYLEEYGTNDIFFLWIYSIILGLIVYSILSLWQNWSKQQITPNPDDDPITILEKLHRRNLNASLEPVSVAGQDRDGFLVAQPNSSLEGTHWVIPPIALKYRPARQPLTDLPVEAGLIPRISQWVTRNIIHMIMGAPETNFTHLQRNINQQRGRQGRADELAKLLKQGQDSDFLTVSWQNLDWIQRPTQFPQPGTQLQRHEGAEPSSIVQIEDV